MAEAASGTSAEVGSKAAAWVASNGFVALLLSGILIFSFGLRITNVNWDQGQHLHPDERFLSIITSQIHGPDSVGQYFDSANSALNPYHYSGSFVYGTFPLFLNKAVAGWLDRNCPPDLPRSCLNQEGHTHKTADWFRSALKLVGINLVRPDGSFPFDNGYDANQVGRVLSALFDVATVALIFELGRVMFNRRVGLLAAALLGLTVLNIQHSHFFGSETFLAFFVTAVIYFSIRITKSPSRWNYVGAGLAYGLALATKLNAIPVLGIPAIAVLMRMGPQLEALYHHVIGLPVPWRSGTSAGLLTGQGGAKVDAEQLVSPLLGGLLLLLIAGLVFRVAEPYAFNGPGFFDVFRFDLKRDDVFSVKAVTHLEFLKPAHYFSFSAPFLKDIAALRNQQSGATDFPPGVQWIGRTPFLFPLSNIALWGLGVPLALAVFGSILYAAHRLFRRRDFTSFLPLVWVVFFFLFIARGFNPTMRYFIGIYPSMALLAAFGLVTLWDFARSGKAADMVPRVAARLRPYVKPALQGAVGLSVLGTLLWALAFLGVYRQDITRVQASKWIASNVPAHSVLTADEWDDGLPLNLPGVKIPDYPHVALKPYAQDSPDKLKELVTGLDQTDYVIESSNRLYDTIPRDPARYPSTYLYFKYLFDGSLGFEKVAEFTNYPRLFGIEIPDQGAEEAFSVYDHPKVTIWRKTAEYSHDRVMALLQPAKAAGAVLLPSKDAATNALLLRPDDLATQREGGTWDDVFSTGGFAGHYPALFWLLVIEIAAVAVTPISLVVFRRLPDRGYLLSKPLGLMLLAYPVWLIVSLKLVHFEQATVFWWLIILLGVGAAVAARFNDEILDSLRRNWRIILLGEALFLLAFFGFYELRLINPDLWHPYRGGEKPMDLAYFTAVTRSTTLPPYDPWFAGGYINYYYLGQFFAATITKLTGIPPEIAFNLAVPTFFALTVGAAFSVAFNLAAAARAALRWRPGFRAVPFWSVAATGVLGALFVTVLGNLDGVSQMADSLSKVSTWHVRTAIPLAGTVLNGANGLWQVAFHGAHLQPFDFWRPSRMLSATQGGVAPITEFPYFSYLFADLHAHMMAISFAVLSIGASLGLALGRERKGDRWREWALVALLGLIVGSLRWLNSWDYPPFLLLALAAVVIGERRAGGGLAAAGGRVAGKAALLVGLSFLLYWPFLRNYEAPVSGVHGAEQTTMLHQYLEHFGLFAAAIGAWLLYQLVRALRRSPVSILAHGLGSGGPRGLRWALDRLPQVDQIWLSGLLTCLGVLTALVIIFSLRGETVIAAMIPILAVITYLAVRELRLRRPDGGVRLFVLAMLGLGFGLSFGVDLVTINGDITRMNTVFKFYLHVWVLFGLAASFAVWYLVFVAWSPAKLTFWKQLPRFAGGLALGLLVLGAAIYPLAATPVRLDDRFVDLPNTLDGTAYMPVSVYNDPKGPIALGPDYDGIQWLRHNVEGTPAIIEGRTPQLYSWGSRFSIYTGLPTVLGWDWHQKQQRGKFGAMVDQRAAQVDRFYGDPDPAQAIRILVQYDVRYVIVGQLERLYYPKEGLVKFESGLQGSIEVAYQNPSLTIYRVKLTAEALQLKVLP